MGLRSHVEDPDEDAQAFKVQSFFMHKSSPDRKSFVHLHVHSEFSLLDGLSRIDHLARRAKELGMPALALTDHGTMYGTIQFYRSCKRAGIKPIIGVETYLAARRMDQKEPDHDRNRFHLLLLAQNQEGYQNLLDLVSASQLEGFYYRPRTDRHYLEKHSEGLITTTGCLAGEIPRAIQSGNMKKAHKLMSWYVDVFGRERFFIELQDHSIPELNKVNKTLLEMAPLYGLGFLATNDVHYTTEEEAGPHDVLLCIQTGKSVDSDDRLRMSDQSYYLKSYDEMAALFGHIPGALENSLLIAEMCSVNPEPEGYHLPNFDVPDGFTPPSYLRHLCEKGLVWRYGQELAASDVELRARLDHELDIIHRMGFDAYFLIVWDLCEFARKRDIWWNVRGSGAGSVVAYTLGITGIDPLSNGLIFERFLNPGRISMPDIDLDYPDDRRQEMIEYTIQKYGSDKVAQIITFGTMGARAAIRDVGRALEVPLPEVDSVARLIPAIPGKPVTIQDTLRAGSDFYSPKLASLYKESDQVRKLVDTAQSLEGVSRHASTHAAGVIISDIPLVKYAPLHRPTSGSDGEGGIGVITQWPMEILDSIGLLKVDFLGLSTLTVLRKVAELIEERHRVRYTMENIPYDVGQVGPDPSRRPETLFEMLGRGEVGGVFQVEGAGMRRLMMEMQPKRFDNIVAAISLYRPGPMENIPEYIARMHGRKEVRYHHQDLEPILKETYGILVYQEQIIRIASDLAGYAPGEADMIRKAVAKKKRDLMNKHRSQFFDGAMAKGYSEETCEAIWGDIEFFARYGFNKAHAADYAVITCQTAFLKSHYPVEYMTALLSVERNHTDKVAQYLAEARRKDIEVLPPEINRAKLDFTIETEGEKPSIRFGLGAIKNTGEAAVEMLLEEREANGPFADIADLSERVDLRRVGRRAMESMIKVGVFDEWGERPLLLDALDRIMSHSGQTHDAAAVGQMSLFGGDMDLGVSVELLRPTETLPKIDQRTILEWEKELIGVYVSEHPLSAYLELAGELASVDTADLETIAPGRSVAILGLLSTLRTHVTKTGKAMAFGALEDLHGTVDLVFFPRVWKDVQGDVQADGIYLIRGELRRDNGEQPSLIVRSIEDKPVLARAVESNEKRLPSIQYSDGSEGNVDSAVATSNDSGPDAKSKTGQKAENRVGERQAPIKSVPPPPPNFEFDDAIWAGPGIGDNQADLRSTPEQAPKKAPQVPETEASQIEPDNPVDINRSVLVEIKAVSNWQDVCRRLVQTVGEFDGSDRLRITIQGQKMIMDLPNHTTRYCPELRAELSKLAAVAKVEVVEI